MFRVLRESEKLPHASQRALRRLQREQEPKSSIVFISERGTPFTTAGFCCPFFSSQKKVIAMIP